MGNSIGDMGLSAVNMSYTIVAVIQALGTGIGMGVTMLIALVYLLRKEQFTLSIPLSKMGAVSFAVVKIGIVPFGLAMSPNISLIIINRFSVSYGGEPAIATYACIAYVICIICLILQGVGDGSQPLISQCYGEKNWGDLKYARRLAYGFSFALSVIGCIIMFVTKGSLGVLFGASDGVNARAGHDLVEHGSGEDFVGAFGPGLKAACG